MAESRMPKTGKDRRQRDIDKAKTGGFIARAYCLKPGVILL